jgi:hypothetical protein
MKQSAESDYSAFVRNSTMQQQQLLFIHQQPFLKITISKHNSDSMNHVPDSVEKRHPWTRPSYPIITIINMQSVHIARRLLVWIQHILFIIIVNLAKFLFILFTNLLKVTLKKIFLSFIPICKRTIASKSTLLNFMLMCEDVHPRPSTIQLYAFPYVYAVYVIKG